MLPASAKSKTSGPTTLPLSPPLPPAGKKGLRIIGEETGGEGARGGPRAGGRAFGSSFHRPQRR
jgi:hypothetical protein